MEDSAPIGIIASTVILTIYLVGVFSYNWDKDVRSRLR